MKTLSQALCVALLLTCGFATTPADEVPPGALQIKPARRPANKQTIWGLNENDNFTASVNIDKVTTVQLGDQKEIVTHTNDQLSLYYYIAQVLPNGDCILIVEVGTGERNVDEQSPDALKTASRQSFNTDQQSIPLIVHPDGTTELQSPHETRGLIQALVTTDPKAQRVLAETLTDEVVLSWLSTPFWANSKSLEKDPKAQLLTRTLSIAAGNFGSIHIDAELKPTAAEGDYTTVDFTGKGRFTPLALPAKVSQSREPLLSAMSIEVSDFSGRAKLWTPETPPSEQQEGRPLLDELNFSCRLRGEATLPARGQRSEQKLTFSQLQTQSWLVTAHSVGLQHRRLSPAMPIQLR